ncbi:tetratricopeptide repeat protein [Nocardia sp. IFM 10818]
MTSADGHGQQPRSVSAAQSNAMYNLAIKLDKLHHYDEALRWYRTAADAGHKDAMHNLAVRLRYRGEVAEAATWWKRAGHEKPQGMTERLRGMRTERAQSQTRGPRRSRGR